MNELRRENISILHSQKMKLNGWFFMLLEDIYGERPACVDASRKRLDRKVKQIKLHIAAARAYVCRPLVFLTEYLSFGNLYRALFPAVSTPRFANPYSLH